MTALRHFARADFLLFLLIPTFGAVLRLAFLGGQAPSIDEGWSVGAALGGLDHMADVVSHDTHPPLYFLLQWVQVQTLGPGLTADRLTAALFGSAAVPLTMLIALRAAGPGLAVFGGLLVAVSPLALFTSRDARPHVMAATLALAATWLFLRALDRPTGPRLGAYALAAAGSVLTSYATAAIVAAHFLALPLSRQLASRAWLTTALGIGLLCLPWLAYAAPNVLHARDILFSDPAGGWAGHLKEFARVSGYALTGGFTLLDQFNPWLAALVLTPVAVGLLGGWPRRRGEPRLEGVPEQSADARRVLVLVVLVPLAFYTVTSVLGGQFVARYLTPLVAPLAVLCGLAVWRLPVPLRAAAAAMLLVGWSWTSVDVLTRDKAHRDASAVAAFLESNVQPNDAVVFDWFSTRGQAVALVPGLWRQSSEGGYDLSSDVARATSRGGQVWLVADNTMADRADLLASIRPLKVDVTIDPRRIIAFEPRALARR